MIEANVLPRVFNKLHKIAVGLTDLCQANLKLKVVITLNIEEYELQDLSNDLQLFFKHFEVLGIPRWTRNELETTLTTPNNKDCESLFNNT